MNGMRSYYAEARARDIIDGKIGAQKKILRLRFMYSSSLAFEKAFLSHTTEKETIKSGDI
jgi:hypothetical protein